MVEYAKIQRRSIVIRVPIKAIERGVEGAWASGYRAPRLKVTDADAFAKELVNELNKESEDGTTPVDLLFDKAAYDAMEQGAEGIDIHEDQEP